MTILRANFMNICPHDIYPIKLYFWDHIQLVTSIQMTVYLFEQQFLEKLKQRKRKEKKNKLKKDCENSGPLRTKSCLCDTITQTG